MKVNIENKKGFFGLTLLYENGVEAIPSGLGGRSTVVDEQAGR